MMMSISKATIYHAFLSCAALQRRIVTGKPYGPYKKEAETHYNTSDLLKVAKSHPEIRYTSYASMDPLVVHSLYVYAKRNYLLLVADLTGTLLEVQRWISEVIPDIKARVKEYRNIMS